MESKSKILVAIAQVDRNLRKTFGASDSTSHSAAIWRNPPDDLLSGFLERLQQVGGEGQILTSKADLGSSLQQTLAEFRGETVLLTDEAIVPELRLRELCSDIGLIPLQPDRTALESAARAAVGVTTADAGIADTGTVVLLHTAERGRWAALLPQVHVVLLEREKIYKNKLDLLRAWRTEQVDFGSTPLTWVTGPSLTADIEKILVRGAHGPRRLVVIIH
ncbi:MAG: LUD domain-containing protein [bacterium]